MREADIEGFKKSELKAMLKSSFAEIERLRDTIRRLLRQPSPSVSSALNGHPDDTVPAGWTQRHSIDIPRDDGIFESTSAWVRVKHGVIVGAGLKNQSILALAISLGLLDQGAEYHGNLYRDWKAAFLSCIAPENSGGYGKGDPDAWSKEDRYSKLLHRVDQDHIAAMNAIVAIRPKARPLAAFQSNQGAFVCAFEVVAKAMTAINREADDALDAIKAPKK